MLNFCWKNYFNKSQPSVTKEINFIIEKISECGHSVWPKYFHRRWRNKMNSKLIVTTISTHFPLSERPPVAIPVDRIFTLFFLVCVDERIICWKQCRNICYLKYFIRERLFVSLSEGFVLFNDSDKISNKELVFLRGTSFSAQRHKTWHIFFVTFFGARLVTLLTREFIVLTASFNLSI